MGEVDVLRSGQIDRQPREQKIENVVVRAKADRQADDFFSSQQIGERHSPMGAVISVHGG
jgi:hypothetical protein